MTRFAGQGDAVAEQIMRQGADEIARALRQLGWNAGMAVALTGGIGPHYLPYLPEDMCAAVIEREAEPLDGAISLAQDFAQEIADERC